MAAMGYPEMYFFALNGSKWSEKIIVTTEYIF